MNGARGVSLIREDLEAFGAVLPHDWQDPGDEFPDEDFEIWPENWEALQIFNACASQWRHVSLGQNGSLPTGIEYASLAAVMDIHRVMNRRDCLERVQIMENAALQEYRKRIK